MEKKAAILTMNNETTEYLQQTRLRKEIHSCTQPRKFVLHNMLSGKQNDLFFSPHNIVKYNV